MFSFVEYCLVADFKPKAVDFGVNDDADDKCVAFCNGSYVTFFRDEKLAFSVLLQHVGDSGGCYEVIFAATEVDGGYLDHLDRFTSKRTNVIGGGFAVKMLPEVLYVLREMLRIKAFAGELCFNATNERLGRLYELVVRNSSFLREMKQSGYTASGSQGNYYRFVHT